jgi:hypothetical protein
LCLNISLKIDAFSSFKYFKHISSSFKGIQIEIMVNFYHGGHKEVTESAETKNILFELIAGLLKRL